MDINMFFEKLSSQTVEENISDLKKFVKKYLRSKKDTLWEEGAQNLFIGGVLLLIEQKKKPTIEELKHLFALDEMADSRCEIIIKNFKKASKNTISYVAGYLKGGSTTFSGYISILQTYLNRF